MKPLSSALEISASVTTVAVFVKLRVSSTYGPNCVSGVTGTHLPNLCDVRTVYNMRTAVPSLSCGFAATFVASSGTSSWAEPSSPGWVWGRAGETLGHPAGSHPERPLIPTPAPLSPRSGPGLLLTLCRAEQQRQTCHHVKRVCPAGYSGPQGCWTDREERFGQRGSKFGPNPYITCDCSESRVPRPLPSLSSI